MLHPYKDQYEKQRLRRIGAAFVLDFRADATAR
jgi:hypothetical protein